MVLPPLVQQACKSLFLNEYKALLAAARLGCKGPETRFDLPEIRIPGGCTTCENECPTEVTGGCSTSICTNEYKVLLAAACAVRLECKGTYVAMSRSSVSLRATNLPLATSHFLGARDFKVELIYCRVEDGRNEKNPTPSGKDPNVKLHNSSSNLLLTGWRKAVLGVAVASSLVVTRAGLGNQDNNDNMNNEFILSVKKHQHKLGRIERAEYLCRPRAVIDIKHRTYRLASRWLAGSLTPKSETTFIGSTRSSMAANRIQGNLVCPDISLQQKYSEWSPKGAIFTGVKLNADSDSEASVAVTLEFVLLRLDNHGILHEIRTMDTDLRPTTLSGDVIALDDNTGKCAHLDGVGDAQHDHCLQPVFISPTILVVRARSITLYDSTFTRIATHSFGWVDGASATPTSILIRSQSDNPWSLELNSLEMHPFPPFLQSSSPKYPLDVGPFDAPTSSSASELLLYGSVHTTAPWEEHDGCETLIAAVFPGPLNPTTQVRVHEVCMNGLNNWTALDYDEDLGRIDLGLRSGKITIVQL
ncbi:hypothetical protein EV421DRAFT_1741252 [Armillaria borealis]|uniref:Uncharacterized protein n=1 Tax=Armillaria borealis TaxID=47425 RepID=A0AA39J0F7_9AGAR|nr:hypothetical protein EV421DRAFT_1741252 [Armillaria borealis]